jgi:hypothetical protein
MPLEAGLRSVIVVWNYLLAQGSTGLRRPVVGVTITRQLRSWDVAPLLDVRVRQGVGGPDEICIVSTPFHQVVQVR